MKSVPICQSQTLTRSEGDQDAERSTLTTPMMHLAKTAGTLGGYFVRPSGQRGTTQSALQYDVDQQRVSR